MGFKVGVLVLFLLVGTVWFVHGDPQVPCYFVFGDSLMDNGNNNHLATEAKVNFPPYGIDFPDGSTGRFSNGRNIADVIAELLGFENYIPPYATAFGTELVQGVNYASGAAGILDETAQHMGARISMNQQLRNHRITILQLLFLVGWGSLSRTQDYLSKCLYTIGIGNNDYINNYFLPEYYQSNKLYTPEEYAEVLVQQYSQQLSDLYKYGARKFGIFAAGYAGCTPAMMDRYGTNSTCVDEVNSAIVLFNARLNQTVYDLNAELPDANFILIQPPLGYSSDLNVTDKPCCKVSTTAGKGQCVPDEIPCSNRKNYVFWDGFHPTESVSIIDGNNAYEILSPLYTSSGLVSDV